PRTCRGVALRPPFIFVRLPPPPSSTLFPYTTLFRSDLLGHLDGDLAVGRDDAAEGAHRVAGVRLAVRLGHVRADRDATGVGVLRSEEHTSELQSRENLVCRLLLEKKKRTQCQRTART